jgi:hypothetical protein
MDVAHYISFLEKDYMRKSNRFRSDVAIHCESESQRSKSGECLKDISVDGLCFQSKNAYGKDQLLKIQIPLMKPAFHVESRVIWCTESGDNYAIGVKFTNIEKGYRIKTVETLHYLDEYRQQVYFLEKRIISGEEAYMEIFGRPVPGTPDVKH